MSQSSIARMANRLRWGIWITWGVIVLLYIAGSLGLSVGFLRAQAHASADRGAGLPGVAELTIVLLSIALFHLSRMLGAIAAGELFSSRVTGAFRSFALWLLFVAIVWLIGPIAAELLRARGPDYLFEFKLQLRDILTLGITLTLFLVARLLERARSIDEEMREIV